ncbi:hypothetical protein D9613_011235 [Agrocybe pediades]|uniref:Ribosomal RNA methyltransferase FtsJ domain-containing protein n=1 Tax=Agrocybe pediades TaxID=84607 RepID=A0A8H4QSD3_9AGAR|nr:hypothetical protein D9613_011235 [Agrocybe pediades]
MPSLPVAFEHVLLSPTEEEEGSERDDTECGAISEGNKESIRLARSLVEKGAIVLLNLLEVQSIRETADNASEELARTWFWRMRKILGEIDQGLKYRAIPRGKLYFLDLGCSPGGFSSYILGKNRRSIGCGISLPVAEGGHEFCLEDRLRSRYTLFSANITYYALAPAAMNDARFFPLPAEVGSREFDLVLLDGHQLRTQVGRLPWDRDRLLISQIIIALQSVKAGGTIIIKLPMPHKVISAKIVYMFRLISGIVQRYKPRTMHGNRGTFYLVAREVGGKEEAGLNQATFLRALRRLWTELTFGGENGEGRFLKAKDLDFVVTTDALVEEHVDWLVGFGKPLWEVQEEFLRGLLTKVKALS